MAAKGGVFFGLSDLARVAGCREAPGASFALVHSGYFFKVKLDYHDNHDNHKKGDLFFLTIEIILNVLYVKQYSHSTDFLLVESFCCYCPACRRGAIILHLATWRLPTAFTRLLCMLARQHTLPRFQSEKRSTAQRTHQR